MPVRKLTSEQRLSRAIDIMEALYAAGEVVGNINGSYAEYLIWCFSSGMEFGNVIAGK